MLFSSQDPNLPIEIRYAVPNDMGFIFTSWASSERNNTSAKLAPYSLFDEDMLLKMNYLAERSTSWVINLEGEPDTIMGYLIFRQYEDQTVLHYAFIKSPFRNKGILTYVLHHINLHMTPFILTCEPNPTVFNKLNKHFSIVYDPFYFQRSSFII